MPEIDHYSLSLQAHLEGIRLSPLAHQRRPIKSSPAPTENRISTKKGLLAEERMTLIIKRPARERHSTHSLTPKPHPSFYPLLHLAGRKTRKEPSRPGRATTKPQAAHPAVIPAPPNPQPGNNGALPKNSIRIQQITFPKKTQDFSSVTNKAQPLVR